MDTKLSQLNTIKKISMTETERGILRAHMARVMMEPPKLITQSLFQRGVEHGLRIALSTMLFIVFVGGSISAVADNALPGDPLYPFKINVNEEVKGFFLSTPEEQVVWQKNRIESRLNEINTLASTQSLTKEKQATAQKAINSHIADLSKNLDTLSVNAAPTALTLTASLENSLNANKQAIESAPTTAANSTQDKAAAISAVNQTLAKVSDQEIKILSKEIDSIATDTVNTTTATQGATQPTATAH